MSGEGRPAEQEDGGGRAAAVEKLPGAVTEAVGPETVGFAGRPESTTAGAAERAAARIRHREAMRQVNIEGIIRMAAAEPGASDTRAAVDRGWLARFFDHAQDAALEPERQVWARILAREIASPGSFGRRTLAFLGGMDPWELEGFIEYCAFSFRFESGWCFMFDGETARREMWAYGRDQDLTQHWVDIGLLSAETGLIKPASAKGLRIRYRDRVYALSGGESRNADPLQAESGFSYRKFTVTGQQLSEAIRPKAFFGYARNLIGALNAAHGTAFELLEPTPEG